MAYPGFPRNVRFTPVPNPLLGPLLEQIDDLGELKCTLRVISLLHQKKGFPRYVTLDELVGDRSFARAVAQDGPAVAADIRKTLSRAVDRGTLLASTVARGGTPQHVYTLNTDAHRRALAAVHSNNEPVESSDSPGDDELEGERPNVFSLYEENIGMLSPMIADELKEAEAAYPYSWLEDAFREAVSRNVLNWRYISRILESWEREGRSDGRSGRYSKKAGYQRYFRR